MYEIDKNVPMPLIYRFEEEKYPFEKMEIGDSFFASFEGRDSRRLQQYISKKSKEFNLKKFVTRTCNGGIRCWRVK